MHRGRVLTSTLWRTSVGCVAVGMGASALFTLMTRNDDARKRPTCAEARRPDVRVRRANTRLTPLDSVIVGYEAGLRDTASLEKLFKYFASLVVAGEDKMTPLDFVRAITPGVGPSPNAKPINIPLFETDPKLLREEITDVESPSFFRQFGTDDESRCGLIDWSLFIVLTVLLAIPSEQIDVMFHMTASPHFKKPQVRSTTGLTASNFEYLLSHSIKARNHYDPTKSKASLLRYLFGEDLSKTLSLEQFRAFHQQLKREVLKLEYFLLSDAGADGMSLRGFAHSVAARTPPDYRAATSERALLLPEDEFVSLDEYEAWKEVLMQLEGMELAVKLFSHEDGHFTRTNIRRSAKAVAGVDLSAGIVRVLFTLFDPKATGHLFHDDFVKLMRPHGVAAPARSEGADGMDLDLLASCCRNCMREWWEGTLRPVEDDDVVVAEDAKKSL